MDGGSRCRLHFRFAFDRRGDAATIRRRNCRTADAVDRYAGRRIVNTAGEFPRIATDAERRLAMRTATRSIDDPLMATRGAPAMLERSYRDVRDSGLTLGEFSRRMAGARSLRNRERIRTVIRAWQLYERLIARLGAVDPADVLARAADLAVSGTPVRAAGCGRLLRHDRGADDAHPSSTVGRKACRDVRPVR